MSNTSLYTEMFDYLQAPERPTEAQPTLVFGRKDPLLAEAIGELARAGLATEFVVSGSFGKDSGDLWDTKIGEARYIKYIATGSYSVNPARIHTEEQALVGSENARFGLAMLNDLGLLPGKEATTLAHATSLRRLSATTVHEAVSLDLDIPIAYKVPTRYPFDPENPKDQAEAADELLRVIDWGEQGLITAQTELPGSHLIEFARIDPATGKERKTPPYPSAMRLAVLHRLPHGLKRRIMQR